MVTSTNPRQFPPQWSIHYAFKELMAGGYVKTEVDEVSDTTAGTTRDL
jgi:hypothetical protein